MGRTVAWVHSLRDYSFAKRQGACTPARGGAAGSVRLLAQEDRRLQPEADVDDVVELAEVDAEQLLHVAPSASADVLRWMCSSSAVCCTARWFSKSVYSVL